MNTRRKFSFHKHLFPLLLLAGFFFVAGCSDLVNVDDAERDAAADEAMKRGYVIGRDYAEWGKSLQARSRKARHFHLLDRAIISAGAGKLSSETDSVRLLVGTSASPTADSVLQEVLTKHKIFNRFRFTVALHGVALTLPVQNLEPFLADAENHSAVTWTEPDADVPNGKGNAGTVPSTSQAVPWAIPNIGADLSSALAGNGADAVDIDLYILDTGAESSDLNVVECLEFSKRTGAAPCASLTDSDGHGTEVALAAAAMDNQTGIVGVAPGARVHVVKAMAENGNTPLGALVKVIDYLTERKLANPSVPMVVNISLGSNVKTTRYNALDESIRTSIAAGVVYVLSAGNDAIDASKVSPAHVAEAITVGAYNESSLFSSFSNYGPVLDILAPGENVLTLTTRNEVTYTSGTSVAAPHVAGAAALLLSQEPALTPAQVRDRIVGSGQPTISGIPSGTTNRALKVAW